MKLYYHPRSGHSHRAVLFLSILGIAHDKIEVNLRAGEQRTGRFLALNPFGQVPVLDDGGIVVADANAILVYLAKKYDRTDWLPADALGTADVQHWLSRAAGELVRGSCAARLITVWDEPGADAASTIAQAHVFLGLLEAHLAGRAWLAVDRPTIADLAHYAYVAHAPEGNVRLSSYPEIGAWLTRIRALPGFVPLPAANAG